MHGLKALRIPKGLQEEDALPVSNNYKRQSHNIPSLVLENEMLQATRLWAYLY